MCLRRAGEFGALGLPCDRGDVTFRSFRVVANRGLPRRRSTMPKQLRWLLVSTPQSWSIECPAVASDRT